MANRRRTTVKPGQTRTVNNPGGGSTRVRNGGNGKIDIKIKPPNK